jgi:hypothetical protein
MSASICYYSTPGATNMGLTAMSESCGVPYDVLAWTAEQVLPPFGGQVGAVTRS